MGSTNTAAKLSGLATVWKISSILSKVTSLPREGWLDEGNGTWNTPGTSGANPSRWIALLRVSVPSVVDGNAGREIQELIAIDVGDPEPLTAFDHQRVRAGKAGREGVSVTLHQVFGTRARWWHENPRPTWSAARHSQMLTRR